VELIALSPGGMLAAFMECSEREKREIGAGSLTEISRDLFLAAASGSTAAKSRDFFRTDEAELVYAADFVYAAEFVYEAVLLHAAELVVHPTGGTPPNAAATQPIPRTSICRTAC
jgi:hypothetical protein